MSKYKQLLDEISSIEDIELRDKLKAISEGAFKDMDNIKNEAIESRDNAKTKLRDKSALLDDIKSNLKLDDGFEIMDIMDKLKNNSKTDEIEAKYQADLETVRNELNQSNKANEDLQVKFNDTLFTNSINASGVLDKFVGKGRAKEVTIEEFKHRTIYEDGNLYKRDEITGKIATDAITGNKLGIDTVVDDVAKELGNSFLKADVISSGGGSRQTTTTQSKKPNEYTEQERVALFRNNPTEFNNIFNKK